MSELKPDLEEKAVESEHKGSDTLDLIIANENNSLPAVDNDTSLEQSYEVIPAPTKNFSMMDGRPDNVEASPGKQTASNNNNDNDNQKPRSNSDHNRSISFQDRIKKSGSFLAKLQSSSEENDCNNPNNIPSSIANAFSSISSSITSNFNLNSSSLSNNSNIASSLTIETSSTSTKLSQITETREDVFNKKAALERKNLISLTKLIVKDLISSSLLVSRTIDDCQNAVHLTNYFTLIDRVLKHGLKQNLLSTRSASLWSAIDSLPKYLKESTLMSESVRSLANTKTPDGKIKAWMRLAMMQKKLPEYFNELLANKNALLKDIYHDYAFMLNDEAQVFAGLIIGVNVIDCNYFVKDANFDMMDDIIDLSPYLKAANNYGEEKDETGGAEGNPDESPGAAGDNLKAVLDQKNYLEEWNKRLESTITDYQHRMRSLEEQNSKLEMEAKLSEARIQKLLGKRIESPAEKQTLIGDSGRALTEAFRSFISGSDSQPATDSKQPHEAKLVSQIKQQASVRNDLETHHSPSPEPEVSAKEQPQQDMAGDDDQSSTSESKQVDSNSTIASDKQRLEVGELEKELAALRERMSILEASYRSALDKIRVLERDLDVQTSMNADKENTIKIYERDIRDKQSQVESLRNSLNDAKKLNSDLSERLNDTSSKLKDRIKSITSLQSSLDKWKLENKTLASRLQEKLAALKQLTKELENANKSCDELKKYNEKINDELRRERETGQSSSVTVETQTNQINELTMRLKRLEEELKDARPYKDQTEDLARRCRDYEQSLEEIGSQLRESRLEVESLRENSAVFLDSQWMDSKQIKNCTLCQQSFSVTRRKHHCRLCGNVFCQACSDNKMELASSAKPVRVCDTCHAFLLAKFVKSSTSLSTASSTSSSTTLA